MSLPRFVVAAVGLVVAALAFAAPARAEMNAAQKTEIQGIIRDYLVSNPEVLRDALAELDKRQKADEAAARSKAISDSASLIFNSPATKLIGRSLRDTT